MFRATQLSLNLMQGTASASLAAAVTVMHRLPMLAAAMVDPTPERAQEVAKMVGEKVEAAIEGTLAAFSESARIAGSLASGHMLPHEMLEGALAVTSAASHPAMQRARANARRLSRG